MPLIYNFNINSKRYLLNNISSFFLYLSIVVSLMAVMSIFQLSFRISGVPQFFNGVYYFVSLAIGFAIISSLIEEQYVIVSGDITTYDFNGLRLQFNDSDKNSVIFYDGSEFFNTTTNLINLSYFKDFRFKKTIKDLSINKEKVYIKIRLTGHDKEFKVKLKTIESKNAFLQMLPKIENNG